MCVRVYVRACARLSLLPSPLSLLPSLLPSLPPFPSLSFPLLRILAQLARKMADLTGANVQAQ